LRAEPVEINHGNCQFMDLHCLSAPARGLWVEGPALIPAFAFPQG
jgi:hypothetical protein